MSAAGERLVAAPFERSGLASLAELGSPRGRELFAHLEAEQDAFLAAEEEFRSPAYRWPRRPLHTWSRPWEYVYVYHHLAALAGSVLPNDGHPRIADVGSGVTFFPFALAKLGYHVTCTDLDPVCGADLARAARHVDQGAGRVDFRLAAAGSLPFDDAALAAAFSVSVVEHVPDVEGFAGELARILQPGGSLFLTVDVALRADCELGPERRERLLAALGEHFAFSRPPATVHPLDLLTSDRSPWSRRPRRSLRWYLWWLRRRGLPRLFGAPGAAIAWPPYRLSVEGLCLVRKDS